MTGLDWCELFVTSHFSVPSSHCKQSGADIKMSSQYWNIETLKINIILSVNITLTYYLQYWILTVPLSHPDCRGSELSSAQNPTELKRDNAITCLASPLSPSLLPPSHFRAIDLGYTKKRLSKTRLRWFRKLTFHCDGRVVVSGYWVICRLLYFVNCRMLIKWIRNFEELWIE